MSEIKNGSSVTMHYVGTYDDGEEFDSSVAREESFSFSVGTGQIISGLESAILGMKPGDKCTVAVKPEDAYGERREDLVHTFPMSNFPEGFEFSVNQVVQAQAENGSNVLARVTGIDQEEESVTVDFNHPVAGKNLNFEVEILSVE
jgi:peptidylprolyl isomerase